MAQINCYHLNVLVCCILNRCINVMMFSLPANYSYMLFFFLDKMAVPPTYADLGKSAKDIFNKGYGNVFKTPLLHVKNYH